MISITSKLLKNNITFIYHTGGDSLSNYMQQCRLGGALKAHDMLDEAVTAYNKAIELKPDLAPAYCGLGVTLQMQEKFTKAVIAYKQAIKLQPHFAFAYYNLGTAFQSQNKFDNAASAYNKAIQLKPDFTKAHDNLRIILQGQNNLGKVFEDCQKHNDTQVVGAESQEHYDETVA